MVISDQERNYFSYNAISRAIGIFCLWLFTNNAVLAQLTDPVAKNWAFNGSVMATARIGNTLYLAGGFTMIGSPLGGGLIFDAAGNQSTDLKMNDYINDGVSDGSNGWYVGGAFNTVLGQTRKGLAQILSDGTLGSWTVNIEGGTVMKMKKSGSLIYLAGDFTTVNGVARRGLAAVDALTGVVSSWNPNVNGPVGDIALDGTNVYICGWFTSVGGQNRAGLAAVNQATGSVLSWNPVISPSYGNVSTLSVSGGMLYLGGWFSSIMGSSRANAAAVNTTTFTLSSWNPAPNSVVSRLFVDGANVYLAGSFMTVKGASGNVSRPQIACVDATTGITTAFDYQSNNPGTSFMNIIGISLIGGTLYLSGDYTVTNNPDARANMIAVDPVTGKKIPGIDPRVGKPFAVLIPGGTNKYLVGGALMLKEGTVRQFSAAIDIVSNTLLAWNPKTDYSPWALAANGSTVYLGGTFTKVGDDDRSSLAEVDAISGKATSWNHAVDVSGRIRTMLINNSTLYVGGHFEKIDGAPRFCLASFDLGTGNLNNWNPNPDGGVLGLAASGNTLYVGGEFQNIGGVPRNFLAALDATGTPTSWNPDMNSSIECLAMNGTTLYAGGWFTSVNNMSINRQGAAAYNITNGNLLPWNPIVNGWLYTIYPTNKVVYLGGVFNSVGATTRNQIAAVSASDASVLDWTPLIDNSVMNISVINNQVYVGGEYYRVSNILNAGMSVFNQALILPLTWGNISASLRNNGVAVNWITLQESNTRHFIVQHSTNGVYWKDLGHVSAAGNSSTPKEYNYLHATPALGINYYRLVQYDLDGRNTTSKIVNVRVGEQKEAFIIIGNPVSDGILRLQLSAAADVAIYSIDGKLLERKYLSAGSQSIDVSVYPKGIYNVRVGKEVKRMVIR